MLAIWLAAQKEARKQLTAQGFRFVVEFGLVGSRAKTDLLLALEGMNGSRIAHPGELQAVQHQANLGRRPRPDLAASTRRCRNQGQHAIYADLRPFHSRRNIK